MEPHPIPQNVTSFEFHLVGDMTLKQFIYLGTGLGVGYLLYATLFYSYPFIALPLIIISVVIGVSFAFLPILDMPLDHWVKAFFHAVYSPTKGYWQTKFSSKEKVKPEDLFFKNRLQTYLSSIGIAVQPGNNQFSFPSSNTPIINLPVNQNKSEQPNAKTSKIPSEKELVELVEMARQTQILQNKIADTEKLIKQMTANGQSTELNELSSNLQNLIQQTEELYKKTSEMNQVTAKQVEQPQVNTESKPLILNKNEKIINPKVRVTENIPHLQTPLVLTSTPNVINGVITDQTGNYLENVIVIIHNKEGVPVRALKTNKLGQFVGSTPLPSGVYTVTLEKEGFSFQTLEITLDNSKMAPVKMIANEGAH